MRAVLLSLVVGAISAPVQCGHDPDPTLRREDTAGDALYALAADFRAQHDDGSARRTLHFLIEKYPSSRRAGAARDDLKELEREGGAP